MSESEFFTIIHGDGGARPNPGEGAYVAILQNGDKVAAVGGYSPFATNNQMELAAVVAGLHALKSTRIPVKVVIDSVYVFKGASRWVKNWRRRGWRNADNKPIKNPELWQALDDIAAKYVISWQWVKAHAETKMNNMADLMVGEIIMSQGDLAAAHVVSGIPFMKSPWDYTGFYAAQPVSPEEAALKLKFKTLLKG